MKRTIIRWGNLAIGRGEIVRSIILACHQRRALMGLGNASEKRFYSYFPWWHFQGINQTQMNNLWFIFPNGDVHHIDVSSHLSAGHYYANHPVIFLHVIISAEDVHFCSAQLDFLVPLMLAENLRHSHTCTNHSKCFPVLCYDRNRFLIMRCWCCERSPWLQQGEKHFEQQKVQLSNIV